MNNFRDKMMNFFFFLLLQWYLDRIWMEVVSIFQCQLSYFYGLWGPAQNEYNIVDRLN